MATLDEIFNDPKALETILRGIIAGGTAAAGIQQATTPQTTTVVHGTPGAASPLETEALSLGFGGIASQFPGQGLLRTPTGIINQQTPQDRQSALGLQQALRALQSRVGGGPLSLQGPADAMTNAALTQRPTINRAGLIAAIQAKMGGQVSAIPNQGSVLNMNQGTDGAFSFDGTGTNIPSNFTSIPSSTVGAATQPKISTTSGGGIGSALGTITGIAGAGAGAVQIARGLGLFGETGNIETSQLLASKLGIGVELAKQLVNKMPLLDAVDLGLKLRGVDINQIGKFGQSIFPQTDPNLFDSALGTEPPPFESAFSGLDFQGPETSGFIPGVTPMGAPQLASESTLGESIGSIPGEDFFSEEGLSSLFSDSEGGGFLSNFLPQIGSTGLGAALTAAGIPLSFILGSLPFIGQRAKIEKAREQGWAATIKDQISSNPTAWRTQILSEHPELQPFVDASLAGGINSIDDALAIFEKVAGQPLPKEDVGGVFSGWANRFIAQPGEKLWGPALIESNKAAIAELLADPLKSQKERQATELENLTSNPQVRMFMRDFAEREERDPTLDEIKTWLDNREKE